MHEVDVDQLGPVDYVVVEFPAEVPNFPDEIAAELTALIDSNTVRVLDLLLLEKGVGGEVTAAELRESGDNEVGRLRGLETDVALLLAEEDIEEVGRSLAPGTRAAVLVWENTWASPFGAAVRRAGGMPVTSGRIPSQAIEAAIEARREAVTEGV